MDAKNQRKRTIDFRPPLPLIDDYTNYGRAVRELGDSDWLWLFEELSFAWREAQFEATLAYRHWCRFRDHSAYAIYRAAQDRADAAQDALRERHAAAATGKRPVT